MNLVIFVLSICSLSAASANISTRIFGGYAASILDFPYQVAILRNGEYHCGGAIVDTRHVVSAAHCFDINSNDTYSIRSGSSFHNLGGKVQQIEKNDIHIHEKYENKNYDIAVVGVNTTIIDTEFAQKIPLPVADINFPSQGIVTGWGICDNCNALQAQQLRAVDIPILPLKECVGDDSDVKNIWICAGVYTGSNTASERDAGGPLVANGYLVGLVSHGSPHPYTDSPVLYTNVIELRDWITQYLHGY